MSEHFVESNSTANAWCAKPGDEASRTRRPNVRVAVAFIANTSVEADLPVRLKIVLDPELHDTRQPCLCRDAAKRARIEVHDRVAPVEVVEQVERFETEFKPLRRADNNQLGHGEVNVPVRRTDDGVAGKVAEGARGRLGK